MFFFSLHKFKVNQGAIAIYRSKLKKKKLLVTFFYFLIGLSIPIALIKPARSAEKIYTSYGPLEFSLPVKALEDYAKTGKIDRELIFFADYLTNEQLEQLRHTLTTPVDLTPVAISQFLYSPQGEIILKRVGQIIQTTNRQSGFYALRSALILAATKKEGLTLLNVLKEFPTYGIRINSENGLAIVNELDNLLQITDNTVAVVTQQANLEISNSVPVDFSKLPDLRQAGTIPFRQETLELNDLERERKLFADIYLPDRQNNLSPTIVISHGLGSDRTTYAYLARHLASHGFAVVAIEHPGSNASQIKALFEGFAREVTPSKEIIDRPLDIKYLLDYLEQNYSQELNVQRVGIVGQSFGAYTALALAGAEIDFGNLTTSCKNLNSSLNISLILQCLGRELLPFRYDLSDRRIVAAIAINPPISALFGRDSLSKLKIPITIVSSGSDPVTPALAEQIQPFTWLTSKDKYLAILENATHFSTLGASSTKDEIAFPPEVVGPDPTVAQNYLKAIALAFFETYIEDNSEYKPYLSAGYARTISQKIMPLDLIRSLDLK
jgi:predicted dienelactone hydrolase